MRATIEFNFATYLVLMQVTNLKDISKFWVAGINYKRTEAGTRGQFAVQHQQYATILEEALENGLDEIFVLSTCNRTEIYGFADTAHQLVELLCRQTEGSTNTFLKSAYIKNGNDAITHLFAVSAGMDSQILGDYEIIGQIKTAVQFAKIRGCINALSDRLINTVLQSSKAIKNQTELSGGTISVSFAAIQYIREHVQDVADKKILLLGTGKMGRSTCKNIVHYLKTKNITLINRTGEKAEELANELGVRHASFDDLQQHITDAGIILVATDATEPVIRVSDLETQGPKLILDLSIPCNVEPAARQLANITLVNVDELSRSKDETLAKREAELPKAKRIIEAHISEFREWYEMRKHVPALKAMKTKLKEIHKSPLFIPLYNNATHTDEKIQRVINGMAFKMKEKNQKGCHCIEAINEFIATGTN